GAGNDIERATSLARRMVTVFGMSDVIGPMAVGDAEHEVFLGREIVQRRELSEKMAELVDSEIKRLLTEAYERAMRTLQENRDLLERLANALLERETLDREEIELLARGEPLPPLPRRADGASEGSQALVPAGKAASEFGEEGSARSAVASRAARTDAGPGVGAAEGDSGR